MTTVYLFVNSAKVRVPPDEFVHQTAQLLLTVLDSKESRKILTGRNRPGRRTLTSALASRAVIVNNPQ
jgi:hypothetical protein